MRISKDIKSSLFVLLFLSSALFAQIDTGTLLDEMINRETLAKFPTVQYTSKQASSYDRASVSPTAPDWFANADWSQFIRSEYNSGRKEWVMMDTQGPGAITRWWITGFDFPGTIRIYLDGSAYPVLYGKADELIGGSIIVSSPLSSVSANGRNLYLPIPYSQSCKITYEGPNPHETGNFNENIYYNIVYRTYQNGTNVRSFTNSDLSTYATKINTVGTALLNPSNNVGSITNTYSQHEILKSYSDPLVLNLSSGAAIKKLQIHLLANNYPEILTNTWIEISFDGEICVEVPLSEFFSSGYGVNVFKDWWRSVESSGVFTAYWVMPFNSNASIKIYNKGPDVADVNLVVSTGAWSWDSNSMYFHATNRQQDHIHTTPAQDWNFVEIQGQGVFVGDTLSLYNPIPEWWGEGDEKFYIDGETFPSHFGTGTEDYYGYAWCTPDFFEAPFIAQPIAEGPNNAGHVTNTRTRSLDAIPFNTSLKFDMEILHWKETDVDFNGTAYWYAKAGATSNISPMLQSATDDDFNDGAVDVGWEWIDSDSDDSLSLTERDGYLRVKLSSGTEDDWAGMRLGAPYGVTKPLSVSDYTIETWVDLATANGGSVIKQSMGGLALYDKANDLAENPFELRFGLAKEVSGDMVVQLQLPGVFASQQVVPITTTSCFLKLVRNSRAFQWDAYYKINSTDSWTLLTSMAFASLPGGESGDLMTALFAITWGNIAENNAGANFDFDYFKMDQICGAWGFSDSDLDCNCRVDVKDFNKISVGWKTNTIDEAAQVIVDDLFTSSSVGSYWDWVDSDSDDSYGQNMRSGFLRIALSSGGEDAWGGINAGAPYLLANSVGGAEHYSVETRVDMATGNGGNVIKHSMGGIVLFDHANDLNTHPYELRLGLAREIDNQIVAQLQGPGYSIGRADLPANTKACYLRLRRDKDIESWVADYKINITDPWETLAIVGFDSLPGGASGDRRVGLFAMTWANIPENQAGINADFDYINISQDCGTWGYNVADINRDCSVDMLDLSELATSWMDCSVPNEDGCVGF